MRAGDGCLDFHLSADPVEAVEAFRGSGPSGKQTASIRDAAVSQHDIASSMRL